MLGGGGSVTIGPFMFVLVGYSVTGRQIVVVVRSGRMSLSGQPRVVASSRHDSGGAKR